LWGIGWRLVCLPILFRSLELRAGELWTLTADFKALLFHTAGDKRARGVLIRETWTAASRTSGLALRVVSGAQAAIQAAYTDARVVFQLAHCPNVTPRMILIVVETCMVRRPRYPFWQASTRRAIAQVRVVLLA
jgi:hypothetical protein